MSVGRIEKQGQKAHYCSGLNSGLRAKTSSAGKEVLKKMALVSGWRKRGVIKQVVLASIRQANPISHKP